MLFILGNDGVRDVHDVVHPALARLGHERLGDLVETSPILDGVDSRGLAGEE